ncbi:TrkH family potassium uptake protein [Tepidibacillus fermentans]|uniref:Trk system potassium uptake protein TrkH n=1 Tax=Tepidibacillus fermentans TaxID=1281767 RepID=A0A4R3KCE9_9BACI|nr:TrkH family potassium uptake protein [Tepidibacillus fermentans]TCS80589.1 trk system potassium uptake protein TrkH [Tepidibacillus fermentans]
MKKGIQLSPPQILVIGFLSVILFGAILLSMPFSLERGVHLRFLDALFTATSAVTVTGLNVIDPGTTFNRFGEIIIMLLIQVGGIGFMAFAITIFVLLGKKIGLKQRLLMQEGSNQLQMAGVVRLALYILQITVGFELIGAILLALSWHQQFGWGEAFYLGIFHSIAAFNNAGFSLFTTSLMNDVGNPLVNFVITSLIIIGGLGFVVLMELWNKKFQFRRLSLHSKVTLTVNLILISFGTIITFLLEYGNSKTLGPLSIDNKLLASYFQTVTTRTAGFNTLDIGSLTQATLFIYILYMFIGAASGSTGGGIKVTTMAVLLGSVKSLLRGKRNMELFKRTLSVEQVLRSLTIIILSLGIVILSTLILDITERGVSFLNIVFEVVSAFGTVGLSMGITPHLSIIGRIVIITTMFVGKLGPLTIGYALARKEEKEYFRYPEEKMMIG